MSPHAVGTSNGRQRLSLPCLLPKKSPSPEDRGRVSEGSQSEKLDIVSAQTRRLHEGRRRKTYSPCADAPANTTIAIVATDARLRKAQMKRVAIMAQDGVALALRPAHAPMDGDIVFAATTSRAAREPDLRDLAEIGMLAAECLARAIARGIYEAAPTEHAATPPCWRERYGR